MGRGRAKSGYPEQIPHPAMFFERSSVLEYRAMRLKWITALFTLFVALALQGKPVQDTRTVWQGVYTDAQATLGRVFYEESCSRCHAADLSGRVGSSLKGDIFMRDWGGRTLSTYFERIKTTMPRGDAGTLSDDAYLQIVAYILRVNGFPASPASELKPDQLATIKIESKDGPGIVPNFALVESVGCLSQETDKGWTLTDATDVVKAMEAGAPNADTLKTATELPLGKFQFRLLYVFPAPDAMKGHKVHSKGLLIRDPKGDSINVTSLKSLAPTCK